MRSKNNDSMRCPHCDCKISLRDVEKEEGICPECGSPLVGTNPFDDFDDDDEEYDDLESTEFDDEDEDEYDDDDYDDYDDEDEDDDDEYDDDDEEEDDNY